MLIVNFHSPPFDPCLGRVWFTSFYILKLSSWPNLIIEVGILKYFLIYYVNHSIHFKVAIPAVLYFGGGGRANQKNEKEGQGLYQPPLICLVSPLLREVCTCFLPFWILHNPIYTHASLNIFQIYDFIAACKLIHCTGYFPLQLLTIL